MNKQRGIKNKKDTTSHRMKKPSKTNMHTKTSSSWWHVLSIMSLTIPPRTHIHGFHALCSISNLAVNKEQYLMMTTSPVNFVKLTLFQKQTKNTKHQ